MVDGDAPVVFGEPLGQEKGVVISVGGEGGGSFRLPECDGLPCRPPFGTALAEQADAAIGEGEHLGVPLSRGLGLAPSGGGV